MKPPQTDFNWLWQSFTISSSYGFSEMKAEKISSSNFIFGYASMASSIFSLKLGFIIIIKLYIYIYIYIYIYTFH